MPVFIIMRGTSLRSILNADSEQRDLVNMIFGKIRRAPTSKVTWQRALPRGNLFCFVYDLIAA
jgi:hypothetical protein